MALVVALMRRTPEVMAVVRDRRAFRILTFAAVVISVNWAAYIWGVNNGRVVETSLGYFINPLVTVLMGVFILGERLRRLQWVAVGIASLAVVVLTLDYGRLPYVALVLAFSFGSYGLAKKQANVDAVVSLTIETAVLAPLAGLYVAWLVLTGASSMGSEGIGHALLFLTTGIITAVPLICFGGAATRVPISAGDDHVLQGCPGQGPCGADLVPQLAAGSRGRCRRRRRRRPGLRGECDLPGSGCQRPAAEGRGGAAGEPC